MTRARQGAGGQAKRAGSTLEALLEVHHDRARQIGIADVRHVDPPVRRIRTLAKGQFVAIYAAKSGVDFRGVLRGGQALAIEAKSSDCESLAWSEFTETERADLDACLALGGLALVVWRVEGAVYAIPWGRMPWAKRGNGRSVAVGDARAWEVRDMPYLLAFVAR